MSIAGATRHRRSPTASELRFFPVALRLLLGGYLFFSKPFAYISVPGTPVYIGEVVLAVGLAEVLRHRARWLPVMAGSPVLKILLLFMATCAVRLLTSVFTALGTPIESVRDSSIWYYGGFAFLTAYYATYHPTFTADLLRWFRKVIPWFLIWVPLLITVGAQRGVQLPGIPLPLSWVKPSDVALSCGMAVAFLILRPDRGAGTPRPRMDSALVVLGIGGLIITGSQNRGGFLAGALVIVAAVLFSPGPRLRRVATSAGPLLIAFFGLLLLVNPAVEGQRRDISFRQFVSNVSSVVGQGQEDQSGTAEWRRRLWADVLSDAVSPEYILHGQGFGPNLYLKYRRDYVAEVPLRNPHSSHLDVLARAGLPAFVLWIALWLVWLARSTVLVHRCRRRPAAWLRRDIAVWLSASVMGFLVNGVFDPSLEGPHAGIWLWVLVGLGACHFKVRTRPVLAS